MNLSFLTEFKGKGPDTHMGTIQGAIGISVDEAGGKKTEGTQLQLRPRLREDNVNKRFLTRELSSSGVETIQAQVQYNCNRPVWTERSDSEIMASTPMRASLSSSVVGTGAGREEVVGLVRVFRA